ncbi:MAG: hypothetical protein DSZ09_02020, partial [Sulfurovum sp.]
MQVVKIDFKKKLNNFLDKKNQDVLGFFIKLIIFIALTFSMFTQVQATLIEGIKFNLFHQSVDRYSDMIVIGNGALDIDANSTDAANFFTRNSSAKNNDNRFHFLDVDSNAETFQSSQVVYTIPTGKHIEKAILSWTGKSDMNCTIKNRASYDPDGDGAFPAATGNVEYDFSNVKISFNGGDTYEDYQADVKKVLSYQRDKPYDTDICNAYKDISNIIKSKISNHKLDITVANISLAMYKDPNQFGGWVLYLALKNDTVSTDDRYQQFNVFMGNTFISEIGEILYLDGFKIPSTMTSDPKFAFHSLDGDKGWNDSVAVLQENKDEYLLFNDLHEKEDFFNGRGTIGNSYYTDIDFVKRNPIRDRDTIDIVTTTIPRSVFTANSTSLNIRAQAKGEGIIDNGIVFMLETLAFDYGDAPDSYATDRNNSNGEGRGPSHALYDKIENPYDLRLGTKIDADVNGVPSVNADGDDINKEQDEDGINMPSIMAADTTMVIPVKITSSTNTSGYLNAWIDWNKNGIFDENERITPKDTAVKIGMNNITVKVPISVIAGESYARFRLCKDVDECSTPKGEASNGEVEDYKTILKEFIPKPAIDLKKTGVLQGKGNVGDTIHYTFSVKNTGNVTLHHVQ